jgi:hypothetical protein
MNRTPTALLLLGSAKPIGSTSLALGLEILEPLSAAGWGTRVLRVVSHLQTPARRGAMLEAVDRADLVILSFGLYLDAPPAAVICAMQEIARHRAQLDDQAAAPRLVAMVNCALAESAPAAAVLPSIRLFARQANLAWAGGLAMGMSGMIDGRPLESIGPMTRHLRGALARTADALQAGQAVPTEAIEQAARPLVPRWLFLWFDLKRLGRRPPQQTSERELTF